MRDVSAGGVVGFNESGTVENCYNTGDGQLTGGSAGGVVGWNNNGTVISCYYLEGTAEKGVGDGSYTGNGAQSLSAEDFADQGKFNRLGLQLHLGNERASGPPHSPKQPGGRQRHAGVAL